MAEFGINATNLSAPDTRGAKFVRQPVQDNSSNIMLGTAFDLAQEAYSGYNLSQLDKGIKAAADEYKLRDVGAAEAEAGMAEAAGLRKGVESLWDTLDPVDMDTVNKMETSIRGNLEKYKAAYEQGRMSSNELIARINTVTKEAIARQPGLARELVSQASFYSNLAGVTDQIAAAQAREKSLASAQEDVIKSENRVLEKAGYPVDSSGEERAQYLAIARNIEQRTNQFDIALKQMDYLSKIGELKQKTVDMTIASPDQVAAMDAGIGSLSSTVSNNLTSGVFAEQFKAAGLSATDANLRGITESFAPIRAQLSSIAAQGGETSRRIIEGRIKQIDSLEALYKEIALGGPNATAAQNKLTAMKAGLQIKTASLEHSLAVTNQITAAIGNLGPLAMQVVDPTKFTIPLNNLVQQLTTFNNGYSPDVPLETIDPTTQQGQMLQKFIFSSQDPTTDVVRSPEEVIKANDVNMQNNIRMLKEMNNPTKFMQNMDAWATTVVQEAARTDAPISSRYSPETVEQVNKFFGNVFSNAKTEGTIGYNKASNSFTVYNPDKSVNNERSKRVNTYFKAFISFNGHKLDAKIDEVGDTIKNLMTLRPAEESLKEKSQGAVKQGGLSEQDLKVLGIQLPLKIQSKQDAVDALNSGRITQQEYNAILNEMPEWR